MNFDKIYDEGCALPSKQPSFQPSNNDKDTRRKRGRPFQAVRGITLIKRLIRTVG